MAVFTCPRCHQLRNHFDKIGDICAGCAILSPPNTTGRTYTPVQQAPPKLPCNSCGRVIGPPEGQMMGSGRVYCHNCLNTGAWLDAEAKATGKIKRTEVYKEGQKPKAHFGRG